VDAARMLRRTGDLFFLNARLRKTAHIRRKAISSSTKLPDAGA